MFDSPQGLPPSRECDHRIPPINPHLFVNSNPIVNSRPYCYLFHQKNEIKKQVQNMLKERIIQPSSNPFASPVVLVRKADGSWRLCVDYRALNRNTIKDKLPIPLINDLLDELHEAKVFSKLDLCSGYHQIMVNKEDIHKLAFKTHEGHYKFL